MNHLAAIALLVLSLALCSCNLASKLLQPPVRLIQAAGRTLTDVDQSTPPATAEAERQHGMALKTTEPLK